jgi:hypothetical protein
MDAYTLDHVKNIATDVRHWVEAIAGKVWDDRHDLNGYCAIAAAELHRRLALEHVRAELHMAVMECGSSHCWVVVNDHVVDVTATQFKEFRGRPIVVLHQKEAEQFWFYRTTEIFFSSKQLRKSQQRTGWPVHQVAYR